ncbi:G-protein coupled receptor 157 [Exaiptasia diaphana]|uniref:G-protein coupled receptors family 2 profile 2 domain-containing protein n=1 Tax=Exaiptasia diaphana TaxID=2652724 RepID=A0A913XX01_EXADI|nr:G-protein coupled receptor 157 [Exaiptasia diaphana]KXJ24358.1 putative G-protein coupled receptor 157 [Exaiptasia diaphana]
MPVSHGLYAELSNMATQSNDTDWGSSGREVNQVLSTVAGSLSIFGTIMIFITFALWKDMRTTSRKILVFISIGDLFTAMVNVSGVSMSSTTGILDMTFCKIQSFVNIAAILSSFFWTVYLSIFLYLSLCGLRREREKKVMFVFHVTAWGIPLIVALSAASVGNAFGQTSISDGWCWISRNLSSNLLLFWMFFAGKGWEILSYLAITIFYIKAKIVLKRKMCSSSSTPFLTTASLVAARKADRKFTMVPIIFILLRMWGTIRFISYVVCLPECKKTGPNLNPHIEFLLRILHGVGDSSQGFANFIIFCLFTDKIHYKIKLWCSRVCPFVKTHIADDKYNNYESYSALDDSINHPASK